MTRTLCMRRLDEASACRDCNALGLENAIGLLLEHGDAHGFGPELLQTLQLLAQRQTAALERLANGGAHSAEEMKQVAASALVTSVIPAPLFDRLVDGVTESLARAGQPPCQRLYAALTPVR